MCKVVFYSSSTVKLSGGSTYLHVLSCCAWARIEMTKVIDVLLDCESWGSGQTVSVKLMRTSGFSSKLAPRVLKLR
jgi:hypothetical protein